MNPLLRFLNYLQSNPQLLFWAFIVIAPVFKGILKVLREQKKKRDAMLAAQRAQIEELRTGRPAESPRRVEAPVSARQQMEEAAARRRGQVVQAQRARRPDATPAARPPSEVRMTQVRLPGGIVMEFPVEQGGTSAPPQTPQTRQTEQSRGQRRRGAKGSPQATPPRDAESLARAAREEAQHAAAKEDQEVRARRMASAAGTPATPVATAAPRSSVRGLRGVSRNELRRVLVLREIFGPPISMR